MTVPDEEVFAFVDGELPPEAMARIEAAMATDPQLALRVETQRALRRLLSGAHAGAVGGTPPETLGATTPASTPAPKPAEVIAFPGAKAKAKEKAKEKARPREPRPPRPAGAAGRGLPVWIGLAACLLIGLVMGRLAAPPPVTLSGAEDAPAIAAGPLAQALNSQASGPSTGPVRIAASFVNRSGAYCRAFQASGRAPLAGVACREADAWRVRAVGPAEAGSAAAVAAMISGSPLDAAAEAQARANGWKPQKGAAPR